MKLIPQGIYNPIYIYNIWLPFALTSCIIKQQTKQELKPDSTRTLLRYGTGGRVGDRCSTLPGTDTDRCFVSLTQRQTASEELK